MSAEDVLELLVRHVGTGEHATGLNKRRRGQHDRGVAKLVRGHFVQKRNIKCDHRDAGAARLFEEAITSRLYERMQNMLQTFQRDRVAENLRTEYRSVDNAVRHYAGKNVIDSNDRGTARSDQIMDNRIRIAHRHAKPA